MTEQEEKASAETTGLAMQDPLKNIHSTSLGSLCVRVMDTHCTVAAQMLEICSHRKDMEHHSTERPAGRPMGVCKEKLVEARGQNLTGDTVDSEEAAHTFVATMAEMMLPNKTNSGLETGAAVVTRMSMRMFPLFHNHTQNP